MNPDLLKDLAQRWVHSHEEDNAAEVIYRPASYELPPSRGRLSFDLKADGSLVRVAIGPTDRGQPSDGSWKLEGDRLILSPSSEDAADQILTISSVAPDKLVVKR